LFLNIFEIFEYWYSSLRSLVCFATLRYILKFVNTKIHWASIKNMFWGGASDFAGVGKVLDKQGRELAGYE